MLVLSRPDVEALSISTRSSMRLRPRTRSSRPACVSVPPRVARSGRTAFSARWSATLPPQGSAASSSRSSRRTRPADAPGGDRALRPGERNAGGALDGTYITAMRTAAAAALATRLLARRRRARAGDPRDGCAVALHVQMFRRVREWRDVGAGAPERRGGSPPSVDLTAAASFEDAVRGADVVAAATTAEPVVRAEWVAPGDARQLGRLSHRRRSELDPAIVERPTRRRRAARLLVRAARRPARRASGSIAAATGSSSSASSSPARRGRSSGEQITLYKSVGVAVQDLAAAALVLAAARERGTGREIELEEIHA